MIYLQVLSTRSHLEAIHLHDSIHLEEGPPVCALSGSATQLQSSYFNDGHPCITKAQTDSVGCKQALSTISFVTGWFQVGSGEVPEGHVYLSHAKLLQQLHSRSQD